MNGLFKTQPNSISKGKHGNKNHQRIHTQSLPIEIMQQIFKHLRNQGDDGSLFSCLFVNQYWCNCVASLLWENPFKHESIKYSYLNNFPPVLRNFTYNEMIRQNNKFMVIETYLSCMDDYADLLKECDLELPVLQRKGLLNYPIYLKQLDYGDLENTVDLYLTKRFPHIKDKQEKIQFISKILFQLIFQQSRNLKILTIRNETMNYEFPNLRDFSNQQPGLSNLIKVRIDYLDSSKPTSQNIEYLLKLISLNCDQIHYLDISLKPTEYFSDIIHYISDIIKAQKYLVEFSISFVKLNFDPIMLALLSQKSSLMSVRLSNITFTEKSNDLLKEFDLSKDLSLIHSDGVYNDVLENNSIFKIDLKK